jgi:hypothetical protein
LLSRLLGNVNLEILFLGGSKSDIRMNLSDLLKENRIDLESVNVSILSIEALDSLFLNEFVMAESEDALLRIISKLGSDYRDLLRHIQIRFLSEDGLSLLDGHFGIPSESVWQSAVEQITHRLFDSQIISEFPEIFAEFRKKQFSLLWRGSRDGFKAKDFHDRCDGHANTLTVILDTKGNIFGGFTPVEWESRVWNGRFGNNSNCLKVDDTLESFLFTLKNPQNLPARRFALKPDNKHWAISCDSNWGPCFRDIAVSDNCNANTESYTQLGCCAYTNDTGLHESVVFAGSTNYQTVEIEVFEITD